MTFIWARKRPSGVLDYYLRRTERVNGKPKVVLNIYLGTAEHILELVQSSSIGGQTNCQPSRVQFVNLVGLEIVPLVS